MKYKNKDGIELNFGGMSKEGSDGGGVTLIQEVARETVKLCSEYDWSNVTSMRFALRRTKDFLIENFDLEDENDR